MDSEEVGPHYVMQLSILNLNYKDKSMSGLGGDS